MRLVKPGLGLNKCTIECVAIMLLFLCVSSVEVVECEQPSLPAPHPSEVTRVHGCGADLRPHREPVPGHHRDLQGAQPGQVIGGVEQPEQESP